MDTSYGVYSEYLEGNWTCCGGSEIYIFQKNQLGNVISHHIDQMRTEMTASVSHIKNIKYAFLHIRQVFKNNPKHMHLMIIFLCDMYMQHDYVYMWCISSEVKGYVCAIYCSSMGDISYLKCNVKLTTDNTYYMPLIPTLPHIFLSYCLCTDYIFSIPLATGVKQCTFRWLVYSELVQK